VDHTCFLVVTLVASRDSHDSHVTLNLWVREKHRLMPNMNTIRNTLSSARSHVSPVSHVWPPAWMAGPHQPTPASQGDRNGCSGEEVLPTPVGDRGWRLPSGTVICAACHPRQADANEVVLANGPSGLRWRDAESCNQAGSGASPVVTAPEIAPCPPSPDAPSPPGTVGEPQWI
jgi:hypothetical protein